MGPWEMEPKAPCACCLQANLRDDATEDASDQIDHGHNEDDWDNSNNKVNERGQERNHRSDDRAN